MSFQAAPSHYQTSSLSNPANSPFGRTAQLSQSATAGTLAPFTVRPELDPLEREKREIERRRQRLEDRKARILHAKTRVMGVDVDSLNAQVREHQERERLEQEREVYHDDLATHHAKLLTQLEEERKIQERVKKEELNFFRAQQANEKRMRETRAASGWENLSDTRTNFLNFTGEDREKHLRDRAQRDQQRDWLTQQLSTQMDREARERQDEADYAATQAQILEMQRRNEEEREMAAMARKKAMLEYNQQMAAQKQQSRMRGSAQEQHANNHELASTLSSALLNETVPASALGPHRAVPYHFKGMSSAQRQQILDEQAAQQAALANRRLQQAQEEKDAAAQSEAIRREMLRMDRQKEEYERARLQALKEERQNQAKQKTLRDQYLNHVVYTNPVKEEFFQQFGTSAR